MKVARVTSTPPTAPGGTAVPTPTAGHRLRRVGEAYTRFWTFGSGPLSHGLAMITVPVLLGFAGSALDSWLGTGRLFLLVLATLGAIGAFLSAYYRYTGQITTDGIGKPWTRRPRDEVTP